MTTSRLLDHWSPPDGAGGPVACLATTYAFDAGFFAEDCLSRFLSLSSVRTEGDRIASVASLLEEEERLSEAQVTVVVDRSATSEKRNLRWDLLPVAAPGGLLHAKVVALMWERAARVIVTSANLTAAGYRRQVEVALPFDVVEGSTAPGPLMADLVTELRRIVALAPGADGDGPKRRALNVLDLLEGRAHDVRLPDRTNPRLRVALAAARPGTSPLEGLTKIWKGARPDRATALSPFWDGADDGLAVEAIRGLLSARRRARHLTLVLPIDPYTGAVRAPAHLASLADGDTTVSGFIGPDPKEPRVLHAKCLAVESDDWLAVMIGSSNMTTMGLGLLPQTGHHEVNVWVGCEAGGRAARQLRSLLCVGDALETGDVAFEDPVDEDEVVKPALPLGFDACVLQPRERPVALLTFVPEQLPASWTVSEPSGHMLLSDADWVSRGRPREAPVTLHGEELPAFLVVRWDAAEEATWTANVLDRSYLPPPAELHTLPVEVVLAVLASTRPVPVALEAELRRLEAAGARGEGTDLDPLKRFDSTGLLLQRARQLSVSLWGLQRRLERPLQSLEALRWRLRGVLGPTAIADGLVEEGRTGTALPGEGLFTLAELALTIAGVDWGRCAVAVNRADVRAMVDAVLEDLESRIPALEEAADPSITQYVRDAFAEARR